MGVYLFAQGLAADETVYAWACSPTKGVRDIALVPIPPGAPATGTIAALTHASAQYQALSTDVLVRVDLTNGALAGAIDLGTNAPAGQRITVVDYTWTVGGAGQLFIPVTGGSHSIQDPNTGGLVSGTVQIKVTGAAVSWMYDPAAAALVLC